MTGGRQEWYPDSDWHTMLQARVEKAGGQVLYWNGHRVMGVLAMSRAIGDHCLRPYVIPEPEVRRACTICWASRG